ncbi:MAG: malectin domain-containing carbohydrate-binding protein [Bacteroidota bacterium]
MIILIDESGSLSGNSSDVSDGVLAFLEELECTPVQVAIVEFSWTARYIVPSYQSVASVKSGMEDYFGSGTSFNGESYNPSGATNWQAAFLLADALATSADILLMFTDGVPTAYTPDASLPGTSVSSCDNPATTQEAELYNAVLLANKLKNEGTHIFALGVGTGINATQLAAISGPTEYDPTGSGDETMIATADYEVEPNFSDLQECLENFANNLCPLIANCTSTETCDGEMTGSITMDIADDVSGPYAVTVNNVQLPPTSDDPIVLTGLGPGVYEIEISANDNNCIRDGGCTVTIVEDSPVCMIESTTDEQCDNTQGTVTFSISDGTPDYSYVITNDADNSTVANGTYVGGAPNPEVMGLPPGDYTIMVTDDNDCSSSCAFSINPATGCCPCVTTPSISGDPTVDLDCNPNNTNPNAVLGNVSASTPDAGCTLNPITWQDGPTTNTGCEFSYVRTYTVMTQCGDLSNTFQQTISWTEDNMGPNLGCPSMQVLNCGDAIPAAYTSAADFINQGQGTITDNCSDPLTVNLSSSDNLVGDLCNGYTLTRTYVGIDACQQQGDCEQTIIILPAPAAEFTDDPGNETLACTDDAPMPSYCFYTNGNFNAGTVVYRVNAGGSGVAGWDNDTNGSPSAYRTGGKQFSQGGNNFSVNHPSIPPGTPLNLIKSERYEEMEWNFPVDMGKRYEIRLYFTEIFNGAQAVGFRRFNVAVEGAIPAVYSDLDQFAKTGYRNGFMLSFTYTAGDNNLDIDFLEIEENPAVKAIEILDISGQPECAQSGFALSSISFDANDGCLGTYQENWATTDLCNNNLSKSREWEIVDNENPTITTDAQSMDLGCNPTVESPTFTVSDNCLTDDLDIMGVSSGPQQTGSCSFTQTWTANYTDVCGNPADPVSITYTWTEDNQAPVITSDAVPCQPVVYISELVADGAPSECDGETITISAADPCGCGAGATIDISGWQLDDNTGGLGFGDPSHIFPMGTVLAVGGPGVTLNCNYSERSSSIWNNGGDDATLHDVMGNLIDLVSYNSSPGNNLPVPGITPPTDCPSPNSSTVNLGCVASVTPPTFMANDNCLTSSVPVTPMTSGPQALGNCLFMQTWTANYLDACMNSAEEVSITFTWKEDGVAPMIMTDAVSGPLGCNPTVMAPTFTVSDNCLDQDIEVMPTTFGPQPVGSCGFSQTWTANYTDDCDNQAQAVSITYTWTVDAEMPVIMTTAQSGDLGCSPPAMAPTFTVDDECNPNAQPTVMTDGVEGTGCAKSQTWTATYSNGCQTSTPVSITYTWIEDTDAPLIMTTAQSGPLGCNPTVMAPIFTVADECNPNAQPVVMTDGVQGTGCAKSQTWTATYSNDCHTSDPVMITYTWTVDAEMPVIMTTAQSGDLGCNPTVMAPTFTVDDECNPNAQPTVMTDGVEGTTCAKSQTWTATYSNGCQTSTPVSITYTWTVDMEGPELVCPTMLVLNCGDPIPAAYTTAADFINQGQGTITDNCSDPLTLSWSSTDSDLVGNLCDGYSLTRTYVGIDACQKQGSCEQTITILPAPTPQFTDDPGNETLACTDDVPMPSYCFYTNGNFNTGTVVYRVNAGGSGVAGWDNDTNGSPSTYRTGGKQFSQGGNNFSLSHPSIPPGTPLNLIKSERYEEMQWDFPVDVGKRYEVRLYFAEIFNGAQTVGLRRFNVAVEGAIPAIYSDLDQFAKTGYRNGFMLSFIYTASDVNLDIDFLEIEENPAVKALEILDISGQPECAQSGFAISTISFDANDGCLGTYQENWTTTDLCNNTLSKSREWEIVDNENPTVTTDAQSMDLGCNPIVTAPTFTVSDNCLTNDLDIAGTTSGPQQMGCSYTQTWTANFTDICGNPADPVSITYTWTEDTDAPTISTTAQSGGLGCNPVVMAPTFTVDDECNPNAVPMVNSTGVQGTGCTKSQTWTATYSNDCQTSDPVSITYTWIEDVDTPVIMTNAQSGDLGCNPTVMAPTFTLMDECNPNAQPVVMTDGVEGTSCAKSQTWIATYSNDCQTSDPVMITYTWTVDAEMPVISTSAQSGDLGCNPIVMAPTFMVSDECNPNAVPMVNSTGVQGTGCAKSQTWTATYSNDCQTSDPVSITYTWIEDADAPLVMTNAQSDDLGCNPVVMAPTFTVDDECNPNAQPTVMTNGVEGTSCAKSQTWMATYSNDCYNSDPVVITYTWTVDAEMPLIFTSAQSGDLGCNPTVTAPTFTVDDECNPNALPMVNSTGVQGTGCEKSQTWTATYLNDCQISDPVSITYTWTEDDDIQIVCPPDLTLECDEMGVCLSFEGFSAGDLVTSIATDLGPVGIKGFNPSLGAATNSAMIFDSGNPTGGDDDLGTPNSDFGGPGVGSGGQMGKFQNDRALGNLLIISTDLDQADPNDALDPGTAMTFDFSAIGTVSVEHLNLVDIDDNGQSAGGSIELFGPGNVLLATYNFVQSGNNGVQLVNLGPTMGVESMVVNINGSGAIDNVCFNAGPATGFPTAIESCDPAPNYSFVDVIVPGNCPMEKVVYRTWTVRDACGNEDECLQTIYYEDRTPPVVQCPPTVTGLVCGDDYPTPLDFLLGTDNCDPATTFMVVQVDDEPLPDSFCAGDDLTFTRTYTVKDACGVEASCTQTFTFLPDTENPAIMTDAMSQDLGCNPGTIIPPTFTASDNCLDQDVSVIPTSAGPTGPPCARTQTWTANYDDACDNPADPVSITYTWVEDLEAPEIMTDAMSGDLGCNPTVVAPTFTASDNCLDQDVAVLPMTAGPTGPACARTQTWTANYIDACQNQAATVSITYTWVEDLEAPEIMTDAMSGDLGCNPTVVAPTFTASDNCLDQDVAVLPMTAGPTGPACARTQTWTANYTDACQNQATTVSITYTWVEDLEAPEIMTDAMSGDLGCNPTVVAPTFTASDNCLDQDVAVVPTTAGPTGPACARTQTWTANYTDACQNQATTVSITYTWVEDLEAPEIMTDAMSGDLGCNPTVVAPTFTASDNCLDQDVAVLPMTAGPTGPACARTQTWTANYIDACQNQAATVSITYTWVEDLEAPEIMTDAMSGDLGCNPTVVAPTFTASDNCLDQDVAVVPMTAGPTGPACARTQTWTANYTDACQNQATTVSITYTWVEDLEAPEIMTDAMSGDLGCNPTVVAPTFTASDNCLDEDVAVVPMTAGPTGPACARTQTWTANYTDACQNQATTVSITYTWVEDTEGPMIVNDDLGDYDCDDTFPTADDIEVTDNCELISSSVTPLPFTEDICNGYRVEFEVMAEDACGNMLSDIAFYDVLPDTEGPVITPLFPTPAAGDTMEVECMNADPDWNPFVLGPDDVSVTDNCSDWELTYVDIQEEEGICGVDDFLSIWACIWTATDDCGNESTFTIYMKFVDTQAPTPDPDFPTELNVSCTDIPAEVQPTATDNCSGVTTTSTTTVVPGDCTGNYTILREYTFTDGCGKQSTLLQTVNVTDEEGPVVTGGGQILGGLSDGDRIQADCRDIGAILEDIHYYQVTDNCDDNPTASLSYEYSDYVNCEFFGYAYTLTIIYTATDDCGNVGKTNIVVEFVDTTPPVLVGIPDDACVTSLPDPPVVTGADFCGAATVTLEESIPMDCGNGGTVVNRTWTATDACGNTSSATQQLIIQTGAEPVLAVFDDQGVSIPSGGLLQISADCEELDLGVRSYVLANLDDSGYCGIMGIEIEVDNIVEGDCAIEGYLQTGELVIKARDVCGSEITYLVDYELLDTEGPRFDAPASVVLPCGETLVTPSVSDDCSEVISVTGVWLDDPTADCLGAVTYYTYEWTATDACGNSSVFEQEVRIRDEVGPVFLNLPDDECQDPIDPNGVTAFDECSGVEVSVDFSMTETDLDGCGQLITWTWTATDACGNTSEVNRYQQLEDGSAPILSVNHHLLPDAEDGDEFTLECPLPRPGANGYPDFGPDVISVSDNCPGAPELTLEVTRLGESECTTPAYLGKYSYVWTATDACGNSTSLTLYLTFEDNTGPLFYKLPPTKVYIYCDEEVPPVEAPEVLDVCSEVASFDFGSRVQETENGFKLFRIWTATDLCGNVSTYTQVVEYTDRELECNFDLLEGDLLCGSTGNRLRVTPSGGDAPYTYSWEMVDCDGFITGGANSQTVRFTSGYSTQNFEVTVTDADGCSQVCTISIPCIKLEDDSGTPNTGIILGRTIQLFPNPSTGEVHLTAPAWEEEPTSLRVFDVVGKEVYRQQIDSWPAEGIQFDLSGLAAGTYWVSLQSATTGHTELRKLSLLRP